MVTSAPHRPLPRRSTVVFHEWDPAYRVSCDVFINPPVPAENIHWLLGNGNYSHALQNNSKFFSYRVDRTYRGYHIQVRMKRYYI